jgi:hypothetical protein
MTQNITNEKLAQLGWIFVDNSGDGGLFGYHAKFSSDHRFIYALSTAGSDQVTADYVLPVTTRWIDRNYEPPVMVAIYHTPPKGRGLTLEEGVSACEGPMHEVILANTSAALEFVKWLDS